MRFMIKHKQYGIFYLLPPAEQKNNTIHFEERLVCNITKTQWQLGKKIIITCDNKVQATRIDEILWNFDQNSFLPHDLFGKNQNDIPITIFWSQCCYNNKSYDVLINLMSKAMNFFVNFHEIIDFVPEDNDLKKQARLRYLSYKKIGFNIHVLNAVDYVGHE